MTCGDARHGDAQADDRRSPPVEFLKNRNAATLQERTVAEWRDELEAVIAREALERGEVAVVVVVVAQQDHVDRRQVFEADSRWAHASRAEPRDRSAAL